MTWADRLATLRAAKYPRDDSANSPISAPIGAIGIGVFRQNHPPRPPSRPANDAVEVDAAGPANDAASPPARTATCVDCAARGWWGPHTPGPPPGPWCCFACGQEAHDAARWGRA